MRLPIALLIAASLAGCSKAASESVDTGGTIAVTTRAAQVTTLRETVNAPGTIVPSAAADFVVTAPEPAVIAELDKNVGDAVKAGDVLVRFEIPAITNDLATRSLEVADAITKFDKAKAEAERLRALFDQGLAARNQADVARVAMLNAEGALNQARGRLDSVKALESSAVIRARFNGVVARVWHMKGDAVAAGDLDPIIRVVDPTRLQVAVQMPTLDSARVLPGLMATIQTAAAPEAAIVASKMTPPATAAAPAGATPTVEVRLNFLVPTALPIDSPVQVEIALAELKDVVAIPNDAIQRVEAATFVWVPNENNQATRRDVRVGLVTGNVAQIISGLSAGDLVIVTGLAQLTEGTPITIGKNQ